MKKLIMLFVFLWSQFATSQEFEIVEFGEVLPIFTISDDKIYTNNSFGLREDFADFKFKQVSEDRIEVFTVDKFGIENFEPLIIKKTDRKLTTEEILNNLKQKDNERIYINRTRY